MYTCRANNSVGIAEKKVYVAVNCKCYILSLGKLIPQAEVRGFFLLRCVIRCITLLTVSFKAKSKLSCRNHSSCLPNAKG